jgi:hypothetical protein
MSFSRPIQWYHSHADPNWPDGTFNVFFLNTHSLSRRYKMHGISHLAPEDVEAAPPPTHGLRPTSVRTHPLARWQQGDTPVSTNSWQQGDTAVSTNSWQQQPTTTGLLSRHDSIESLGMDPSVRA